MKGVKFTAKEKKRILDMWLVERQHWKCVCRKEKCTRVSLWRWKKQYDGTLASLENKSSRPKTPHPNSQTEEEKREILEVINDNPTMGYTELYGELRAKYAYSRHYKTMYKYVRSLRLRPAEIYDRYVAQPYDTPEMFGQKWQMDVKFVPRVCYAGKDPFERAFQYTMIDEATRERFIYAYKEHSGYSTADFIQRAVLYFGYAPITIQTDNGTEFTNPKGTGDGKVHIADRVMQRLGIKHQLIRPYTPRHNGKVERSHRTDQERFYNYLQYVTFEELQEKMQAWLIRYNKKPHTALRNRYGKYAWQSPLEKRAELLEILKEGTTDARVRFVKNTARTA